MANRAKEYANQIKELQRQPSKRTKTDQGPPAQQVVELQEEDGDAAMAGSPTGTRAQGPAASSRQGMDTALAAGVLHTEEQVEEFIAVTRRSKEKAKAKAVAATMGGPQG